MFLSTRAVLRPSLNSARQATLGLRSKHSHADKAAQIDLGDPSNCPDCKAHSAKQFYTPIKVVHEGCPIYSGYAPNNDPISPGYVAGSIPCAALVNLTQANQDKIAAVTPAFSGHWVSEADSNGNKHVYDIDATFNGPVRNKGFEDWNNQCLQLIKYTHTTSGKKSVYEAGMFLLDWKFGAKSVDHPNLISATGKPFKPDANPIPNLTRHSAITDGSNTQVVLINAQESGLLEKLVPANVSQVNTPAGNTLLNHLKSLPDAKSECSYFFEVQNGRSITREDGAPPAPNCITYQLNTGYEFCTRCKR